MRVTTRQLHGVIAELGRRLGFAPDFEVSDTLLRVRLDEDASYQPRMDVLWSLPLNDAQRDAIAWALGLHAAATPALLPVCGWEVEATTPSTKTLAADVANLTALGAPLGFLVVNDDPASGGEARIYARAVRMMRTLRYHFGDRTICPLDMSWMESWAKREWNHAVAPTSARSHSAPTGGEKGSWIANLRTRFREVGTQAGFGVEEGWSTPRHDAAFAHVRRGREEALFDQDPRSGVREGIASSKAYFTQSVIDLVWKLPLPASFETFAREIGRRDPSLIEHGLLDPERFNSVVVLAVEFENATGKHAGGGLLNLASHGLLGLLATPDSDTEAAVARIHRTYRPTLGLRNVFVRKVEP